MSGAPAHHYLSLPSLPLTALPSLPSLPLATLPASPVTAPHCPERLQELDLSTNNLGTAMVPCLSSQYPAWNRDLMLAINRMPNLVHLDLSDNQLSVADLIHLLQPPVITSNTAYGPAGANGDMTDEWVTAGVEAHSLPRLESLNIAKNELCGALHGFLEWHTRLTRLDVSDTTLRAESAVHLSAVLACMPRMRWLSLAGNRITQRAAAPLGVAFAAMPGLEYLNASGHVLFNFGPDGAVLADPVCNLPDNLRSIYMKQVLLQHVFWHAVDSILV